MPAPIEGLPGDWPAACREQFEAFDSHAKVAAMVRTGIRAGVFRADLDPESAAASLHAAFVPWHYQRLRASHSPEQIAGAYAELFLRGAPAGRATDPH